MQFSSEYILYIYKRYNYTWVLDMQTKTIDTKFKEIYFNPAADQLENNDESFNKILHIMDLMALQNKAFLNCCR